LIAVDTNVLLRYLLRDDEVQAERARRIFESAEHILITDVVLAEALWVLTGCRHRAAKTDVIAIVDRLLHESNVRFEDDEVIWSALQSYRGTDAGFSDTLIVHKALMAAAGDDEPIIVYTFDADALQLPNTAAP